MNRFTLKMTKGEANALVELVVRGLNTVKRSGPDELAIVEKVTELGLELEDEA